MSFALNTKTYPLRFEGSGDKKQNAPTLPYQSKDCERDLSELEIVQRALEPVKSEFKEAIKLLKLTNGVILKVTNGKVIAFIDVEEFRKD